MGHMIEDRFLRRALLAAMEAEPLVTHMPGAKVIAQDTTAAAQVTLDDGRVLSGRLLVGADGRRSGTAERAGIRRTGWDYGQTALVCAIAHERPHDGIAHQFFMPGGPLAILPLPGNRSSIVWSERTARAAEIAAMDDADYLDALRPAFGDFRGEIELAGARYSFPLSLSIAEAFVAPRLALVGDAAHGVHPIAGQGLNLGLRDVAALAEVLTDARRRGEDIAAPDVLARYQTWRRFDTTAMAVATDAFNRLFSNDNPFLRAVRDARNGPRSGCPGPAAKVHPRGGGADGRRAPASCRAARSETGHARSPSSFQKYAMRHLPPAPTVGSVELPRLFLQHDRDAVADRVGQMRGLRDQLLPMGVIAERAMGHGADQRLQHAAVDGMSLGRRHDVGPVAHCIVSSGAPP